MLRAVKSHNLKEVQNIMSHGDADPLYCPCYKWNTTSEWMTTLEIAIVMEER